jgi:hypothetical protein
VECIETGRRENINSFAAALETDLVLDMLQRDAELGPRTGAQVAPPAGKRGLRETLIRWLAGKPAFQRVS